MLLVGSKALEYFKVDLGRKPSDIDIICYREEFNSLVKDFNDRGFSILRLDNSKPDVAMVQVKRDDMKFIVDASIIDDEDLYDLSTNLYLHNYLGDKHWNYFSIEEFDGLRVPVVKPEVIFMMKMSHKYKRDSVHFEKTRHDILKLKSKGYEVLPELDRICKARASVAEGKPYSLNLKKNEFFTDNVPYKYEHDDLHVAVALYDKPAYTYYIKEGAQVMCDRFKFEALPKSYKNAGVFEESVVLALERAIIPHNATPKKAFELALKKVCTSITSGWFREYAWDNYDEIKSMWNTHGEECIKCFHEDLEAGKIRNYQGKGY